MSNRKHEQLLGYLIGALEEPEHQRIDAQLARDPAMREELGRLREGLRGLEAARRPFAAPPGLAARTCRWIAAVASRAGKERPAAAAAVARRPARPLARRMGPVYAPPSSPAPWSWADMAVVACISAALALLVFPALHRSRMNLRLVTCQDNLRELGMDLAQVRESHPGLLAPLFRPKREASTGMPQPLLPGEEVARVEEPGRWWRPLPVGRVAAQASVHPGIAMPVCGRNVPRLDGGVVFVATRWVRPFAEDDVFNRPPRPNVLSGDPPDEESPAPVIPLIPLGL